VICVYQQDAQNKTGSNWRIYVSNQEQDEL